MNIDDVQLDILDETAEKIIAFGKEINVWIFEGDMGAGKTTLVKAICSKFGVLDNVSSPTFSIVNEYIDNDEQRYYHFDFYRIEAESEALDIGCEEYFFSGDRCFIEWSSKIPNLLPKERLEIHITVVDDFTRSLKIVKHV